MTQRDMRGGNYAAELEPPEVYRERRRRLAERIGGGTIVMWGAGDDRGYGDVGTFRQSSAFFYLTGVELPNAIMVSAAPQRTSTPSSCRPAIPTSNDGRDRSSAPARRPRRPSVSTRSCRPIPSEIVLDARRRPVPGFEGRLQGWLAESRTPCSGPSFRRSAPHRCCRRPTASSRGSATGLTELRGARSQRRSHRAPADQE